MRNKRIYMAGVVFIVIVFAFLAWQSLSFHLVSTDPSNGSQPNQYASVSFTFNKPIKSSGDGLNSVSIQPFIAGKTTVSQKAVTFIPFASYQPGTQYTATLSAVISKGGKKLSNFKTTFTPQYVSYSNLPTDVRRRLISQTDTNDSQNQLYLASVIAIKGTDALLIHGFSTQQLSNLQTAFFRYFESKKEQVRGMVLSNIVKEPYNPDSSSEISVINFVATFDNKQSVSAKVSYSGLSSIRLYLHNSGGDLIYDSGAIGG